MIINSIKRREVLIPQYNDIGYGYLLSYDEILELQTVDGMTPFLLSVKYGHLELAKYLHETIGCDFEAVCSLNQNALHYSVINLDIELVRYMIYLDSDHRKLREQVNVRNKRP